MINYPNKTFTHSTQLNSTQPKRYSAKWVLDFHVDDSNVVLGFILKKVENCRKREAGIESKSLESMGLGLGKRKEVETAFYTIQNLNLDRMYYQSWFKYLFMWINNNFNYFSLI